MSGTDIALGAIASFHKYAPKKSTSGGGGGFWDKVKHFFTDTIPNGIKSAWNWVSGGVKGIVSTVHEDVKGIVSTVHDDVKGLVSGVDQIVEKTEDTVAGVYKDVVHEAGSLGTNLGKDLSSMGMPLAIGAVAIAAVMLMNK